MPTPVIIPRSDLIETVYDLLQGSHCISLIGFSNMGKSTLMRSLVNSELEDHLYENNVGRSILPLFVDCNGMFEMTGQGFYELILRTMQNNIKDDHLLTQLAELYQGVIEPDSQFIVSLNFNKALTILIEEGKQDIILFFDEFDEVFDTLDGRVFLNLRHLKDKYPRNLIYVTATGRRLGEKRMDEQTAEFVELATHHVIVVQPLLRSQADELAQGLAQYLGIDENLSDDSLDFLWEHAGGHPRLLRATVSQFAELYHQGILEDLQSPQTLEDHFQHDPNIRTELTRLWSQIGPEERTILVAVALKNAQAVSPRMLNELERWGLLNERHGELQIFSTLFEDFIQRQVRVQKELPQGVWVNIEAGETWVDGVSTPDLTELEFKLVALLFTRANKVTDKFQIVERVWGVNYIDEVDDSRIEKLISRLRAKIEPDSSNPRYIVTVRGRGYKLITPT